MSFWIPLSKMVYNNLYIYLVSKRKKREREAISLMNNRYQAFRSNINDVENANNTNENTGGVNNNYRTEITTVINIGVGILSWLPFFIWYLLAAYNPKLHDEFKHANNIVYWLGYTNSMCNPIINVFFNATFRRAFLETCNWVLRKKF
jgi:hypothetical protein